MNPPITLIERFEVAVGKKIVSKPQKSSERPTVLIATADPEMRKALEGLLEASCVNAIWVSGVKDVKTLAASERIVACLCGFWLQDGTYREVISHLRRERMGIPAIIVSPPSCPQEYGEYLAAMDLGALNFLSYPYQQSDFEKMLQSATTIKARAISQRQTTQTEIDFRQRGAA
jgi:DNA-binding NtrC family response regulator